jgi:hypothetical protein
VAPMMQRMMITTVFLIFDINPSRSLAALIISAEYVTTVA